MEPDSYEIVMSFPMWVAQLIGPVILAVLSVLVKGFIGRIEDSIKGLKTAVDKIDGQFEALHRDVHKNTTDVAVMKKEAEAVWKTLDGSFKRTSDINGGG